MSDSNDSSTLPVHTETERIGPNWRRAAVKLLPYVGSALDELLFGRLNDSRWARLEETLKELGEMMEARQIPPENALSEDFGGLLETTGPIIGRTTSEEKRSMLRDLLLNAVSLPPSDPKWESARMAGDLLSALEPPSLAIVAALHQLNARDSVTGELERDGDSGVIRLTDDPGKVVQLHYHWFVLEEGYRRLTANQPRIIIAGSHGRDTYQGTALTPLGDFLIAWATVETDDDSAA